LTPGMPHPRCCFLAAALLLATPLQAQDEVLDEKVENEPVPVLSVISPVERLAVGEQVPLQVLGIDTVTGAGSDLTSSLTGTRYGASNQSVLAVSNEGVVTGLAPGHGIVTAFHDGLAAHVLLQVTTVDDNDGDGIPDVEEVLLGLNPADPSDAFGDLDGDGLTNLAEHLLGSDADDSDTDADGLMDGLEAARGRNPLVPDGPAAGEECTVSVLNRSTRLRADGVWVLPNIPANSGAVRVRATCVSQDGTLRRGQSDFFVVPANGVIESPEIDFGEVESAPATLDLSAVVTVLTEAGQSIAMTAQATYPDGSTRDLTAGEAGTSYRSSNSALASVSSNGIVTAHLSGTVLISALNEGALGVLRLQVVLSGDSDGDGLPDDFEIANGLDPNNPLDVLDDPDDDGLSTAEEFDLGLDPFDADTDDDGLDDGTEVTVFATDPLLRDTDGDGVSDGLEVTAGSDPLDADSVDLTSILDSIEVFPAAFDLVFNTAVGEASRRLEVTGHLIDGTTLDLRPSRYGTTYTSSDLAVASFGSEPGRIFAGEDGTAVIAVSNSGRTATSTVTVTTFSPTALSFLALPGFPNGVAVADGYAYVASGFAGLHVVDVSDPENPQLLATRDTPGNANDVRVEGVHAYVADGEAGLVIVDVSDPLAPFLAGVLDTPGVATDLAVSGNLVFVADGAAGVVAIDVSDPAAPIEVGRVDTPGNARGIDAAGDLAVVADGPGGLRVVDVSDPAAMVIVASTHLRSGFSRAADVVVRGSRAYVADGAGNLGGLRVVDFSVPSLPVVVGSTSDLFGLTGVALDEGFVVASDYLYPNAVPIFDVGFAPPVFTGLLDFSGPPSSRDDNGNGIAADAGLVYMVGNIFRIEDNGVSGSGGLHVGRYRIQQDNLGIAPEISLTEPAAGFTVSERRRFLARAEASDDVRVSAVRFLLDGEVVAEVLRRPFEASLTAPLGVASVSLSAEAVDLGGNVGTAEPVSIAILPDPDPVVEILAPNAGSRLVEGGIVDVAVDASDDSAVSSVEILIEGLSAGTFASPPYRVQQAIPVGVTSLSVEARATDDVGQVATTGAIAFAVLDDPSPTVAILEPVDGATVTGGASLAVQVGAVDDLGVTRVALSVDGQEVGEDFTSPYTIEVAVPVGATEIALLASAFDTAGQEGVSEPVVVSVVGDPGTTVVGSVQVDGSPQAGAAVTCQDVSGTSTADGSFSIPGVPSVTDVVCAASFTDGAGRTFRGTSTATPPVAAGVTDVGPIALTESLFEPEIGPSLELGFSESTLRTLPFAFPFFGSSHSAVWINGAGNLTFGAASPFDWSEDVAEFTSGFRPDDGVDVGPAIAAFWDDLFVEQGGAGVERDLFRFEGSAGDMVAAEVHAARIGSQLDSQLTLYDASGAALAFNDDFAGLDSRVEVVLPANGGYFLEVENFGGFGSPDHFYTLTLEGGGAPLVDAGAEVEPNGTFGTATPMAYGDVLSAVLLGDVSGGTRNVHLNEQLPGRFVVTWNNLQEFPGIGSNTVQAILFDDGRVQFGYQGITSDDSLVGISPSDGSVPLAVDYTADAPLSSNVPQAIFEEFDGPIGPDFTDEDPPGTTPFDLDGTIVTFTPNASGGYDVSVTAGNVTAASSALASSGLSRVTASSSVPRTGVVEGRVLPDGVEDVEGFVVVVTSSIDLDYVARATVDDRGRFRIDGVPLGAVHAVVEGPGAVRRAAGVLRSDGEVLELVLRPIGVKPRPH